MLTKIQIDLIETIRNKHLATSVYLSDCLMCSKRSIITYVKEINSEYPILIHSTKKGYFLDEELFPEISEEYHLNQQFSSDYRTKEIIRRFFLSENDTVNINDLSSELYVSDSTIRSDIYDIKHLSHEDISIVMDKADVSILGKERDIRFFYLDKIRKYEYTSFYDEDALKVFFPDFDTTAIKEGIRQNMESYGMSVNEHLFFSIVLHILISLSRLCKGHVLSDDEIAMPKFVRENDKFCAKKIADNLSKQYRVPFNETEIQAIALLLASHSSNFAVSDVSLDHLRQYLWPDLYAMFTEIVDTIKNRFHIDLYKKPSNAIGLALHLRSLIHRSSAKMFVENPQTSNIRHMYPISYECSVYIARKIFDAFSITITEDEITFLAIYIANNMRVYHGIKGKIDVLFFIPSYGIISNELCEYYRNRFEDDIRSDLLTQTGRIDLHQYDLIITTELSNNFYGNVPVITISPFINNEDENRLLTKINELKKRKKDLFVRSNLTSMMKETHCFFDVSCQSPEEAFAIMSRPLSLEGVSVSDLKEDVLIRIRLANTVSNGIALLRPCLNACSANTFSFIRLKEAILIGNEKVSSLILLTFSESKFLNYLHVMEYLYYFISDKQNARKLNEASSYEELQDLLLN